MIIHLVLSLSRSKGHVLWSNFIFIFPFCNTSNFIDIHTNMNLLSRYFINTLFPSD